MIMTVTTDDKTDDVDESEYATTETESEEADDQDSVGTGAEDRRPRSWLRRLLAGALIALFVGALGLSGTLGWMLWQQRELTQAGQQAQQAAVAYAQILTSIDSDKVDENFNQVLDGATGEFKDMYSQSSTQLRQLLIDNKASAHGVVVESAIQSESKNKVVVLLFVDQSVSNTAVPDPRIDRSRIKMTMEFVDGRWRASKVDLP
jgi:Mce-associated membrane protein